MNKKKADKYVFFDKEKSLFGSWNPTTFVAVEFSNGEFKRIKFHCIEQWKMYKKAKLFNDVISAANILKEKDPRKMKIMGLDVLGFNQEIWDSAKFDIMYEGLKYKFEQNKNCYEELMSHNNKTFVYANSSDVIWGVGLDDNDPLILDENNWKGQNILGKALTKLRDEFSKIPVKTKFEKQLI